MMEINVGDDLTGLPPGHHTLNWEGKTKGGFVMALTFPNNRKPMIETSHLGILYDTMGQKLGLRDCVNLFHNFTASCSAFLAMDHQCAPVPSPNCTEGHYIFCVKDS